MTQINKNYEITAVHYNNNKRVSFPEWQKADGKNGFLMKDLLTIQSVSIIDKTDDNRKKFVQAKDSLVFNQKTQKWIVGMINIEINMKWECVYKA